MTRKRAPRGYAKGALKQFTIYDSSGCAYAPIDVQCYIHKSSGSVLGFGLSNLKEGRLECATMEQWEVEVREALRSRMVDREPTKHIAVFALSGGGQYRFWFWPVRRQLTLAGESCWAGPDTNTGRHCWLKTADEVTWKYGNWSDRKPWVWEDGITDAVILDWSPEAWEALRLIRGKLDDAIAMLGELVTSPALLAANPTALLSAGDPDDQL